MRKEKYSFHPLWLMAVLWMVSMVVLGSARPVQAVPLSSVYTRIVIDEKEIDLSQSFGLKGSASGGGTYQISTNYIDFSNYKGGRITVECKDNGRPVLRFYGDCAITSTSTGIVFHNAASATILVTTYTGNNDPSLTIKCKTTGIFAANKIGKCTLALIGANESAKLNVTTTESFGTGLEVKGMQIGSDYMSLLTINRMQVNVQAKKPVRAWGRRYKDSSLGEGLAMESGGGLVCWGASEADGGCVDHPAWGNGVSLYDYYMVGGWKTTKMALTPKIRKISLSASPMKDGKLIAGQAFPKFSRSGVGRYEFIKIATKERGGKVVYENQVTGNSAYTLTLELHANMGYSFDTNIVDGDIQMPAGFTVIKVTAPVGMGSSNAFGNTSGMYITVSVSSEKQTIPEVKLKGLKRPVSGNSPTGVTLSSELSSYTVKSCSWRNSAGNPFTVPFVGGDRYLLYVVLAPKEGYSFGNKGDSVKRVYMDGAEKTTIKITGYINGEISIEISYYADCKVTFDLQGHGSSIAPQYVSYGSQAKMPADPSANGYFFGGWLKNKSTMDKFAFSSSILKDTTIYALWYLIIDQISFTTDLKQIQAGGASGDAADLKLQEPDGLKLGYVGWSRDEAGNNVFSGAFEDGKTYYLTGIVTSIDKMIPAGVKVKINGEDLPDSCSKVDSDGLGIKVMIPYTAHTWPLVKTEKAPTCVDYGVKGHYECSGCGRWYTDKGATKEITDKDALSIPPTGHKFGEWIPDGEERHMRECENEGCGEYETASHVFKKITNTADRTTTYNCTVCGYTEELQWKEEPPVDVPDDTPIPPDEAPPEEKEDVIIREDIKDKELDISVFNLLQLRYKTVTQNSITLLWNKVDGAKAYYIYGSLCGQDYKKLKKIKAGKTLKYIDKNLKKGKYYKYLVTAVTSKNKQVVVIAASKTVHVATAGGKVGNYKNVTLDNITGGKLTLKKGKTFKIKATAVPASKTRKVNQHRKLCYESSNQKIATVTTKGTIKAKKKGTCTIYVYAQSGSFGKITLKVKK